MLRATILVGLALLMAAADKGIQELIAIQRKVLGEVPLKKPKPQA